MTGQPQRTKVISRDIAYHGTTMGALSITGLPDLKTPFEPLVPGAIKVPNTNFYRAELFADDEVAFGRGPPTRSSGPSCARAPTPCAAVYLEPVQNAGGCFPPPPGYFDAGARRSATATASCWSPTRSSAPSGASATGSGPSATATSPTSSRWPRA